MIETKKSIKKTLSLTIALLLMLVLSCPALAGIESNNANLAASTYHDYTDPLLKLKRNKIVTTKKGKTKTTHGSKSRVFRMKNIYTETIEAKYSYKKSTSGKITLGASVPIKAIELKVGGEVKYSYTTTVSSTVPIKPGKTVTIHKRQNTDKKTYKNDVTEQQKVSLLPYYDRWAWANMKSYTTESVWTTKYPELIVSKK
jgi:hypothetical protein